MAEIKFAVDYGYREPAPFWMVYLEGGEKPSTHHASKGDAEETAALIAQTFPGRAVHILGVLATVQTSPDIIGTRFDPNKSPPKALPVEEPAPVPDDPEFGEVHATAASALAHDEPF